MRYLTVAECESLGEVGSVDEVTPMEIVGNDVHSVYIYTQHATYRSARLIPHGSDVYGRIIDAVDALDQKNH